jgi:hypothetical protein
MIVPHWLLYAWFVLAGLSTLYVTWDNFVRKNPEETVMKWGWLLITLYMGPIGMALYVLTDKEPSPGTHDAWEQVEGRHEKSLRVGTAEAGPVDGEKMHTGCLRRLLVGAPEPRERRPVKEEDRPPVHIAPLGIR